MKPSLARNIFLGVAVLYTVLLTWGSLTTVTTSVTTFKFSDKVLHIIAYLGLTMLWLVWYIRPNHKERSSAQIKTIFSVGILIFLGYGILIEALQGTFTDDRIADVGDVIANMLGIALGVILVRFLIKNGILLKLKF